MNLMSLDHWKKTKTIGIDTINRNGDLVRKRRKQDPSPSAMVPQKPFSSVMNNGFGAIGNAKSQA